MTFLAKRAAWTSLLGIVALLCAMSVCSFDRAFAQQIHSPATVEVELHDITIRSGVGTTQECQVHIDSAKLTFELSGSATTRVGVDMNISGPIKIEADTMYHDIEPTAPAPSSEIARTMIALGGTMISTTHPSTGPSATTRVSLQSTGGHETDPRDRGRPVILVASALGVSEDVFRDAFSHVTPAGPGQQPTPDLARRNKQALMERLAKYGITNERLDEVSNYYRYNAQAGEMWKNRPAKAEADIETGKVTRVIVTDAGAGYSSPPTVALPSAPDTVFTAKVAYGKDLATNGGIDSIAIGPAATQPARGK
jgi:hypothetical protein